MYSFCCFRTPQSSCSFISENYRSSCVQVYNYHRLLTWDNKLGLHMDIFKIPTCCSCHVHGYAELFPPHQNDPPPKITENFPGVAFSTLGQKDELVDIGISNVDTIYGIFSILHIHLIFICWRNCGFIQTMVSITK